MGLVASEVKGFSCPEGRGSAKKSDGNGLFLLAKSNGSKLWRFRFKYSGKHQEMALGKYPLVSLADARELVKEARLLLVQGINPMDQRRERKNKAHDPARTFEAVAMSWWERQKEGWSESYVQRVKSWITCDMKPLKKLDIDQIDAAHITDLMLAIEASGTPKKAPTVLSIINRVFAYALAHRLTRSNPAQGLPLRDILKPLPRVQSRAAITEPDQLSKLMKDIVYGEGGSYCTVEALKVLPRIFVRPKEIRSLRWEYIDFDESLIRLPSEEMKKDREFLVPMSKQVKQHFEEMKKVTGYSEYVFPNSRDASTPISKNVMTNRLRSLGYSADVVCAHGFRSTASTILHEKGWSAEVIEVQLAHLVGTSTTRAYNRALYLKDRNKMMQFWSDYLDELLGNLRISP